MVSGVLLRWETGEVAVCSKWVVRGGCAGI